MPETTKYLNLLAFGRNHGLGYVFGIGVDLFGGFIGSNDLSEAIVRFSRMSTCFLIPNMLL